jgi:hypothetical protein
MKKKDSRENLVKSKAVVTVMLAPSGVKKISACVQMTAA